MRLACLALVVLVLMCSSFSAFAESPRDKKVYMSLGVGTSALYVLPTDTERLDPGPGFGLFLLGAIRIYPVALDVGVGHQIHTGSFSSDEPAGGHTNLPIGLSIYPLDYFEQSAVQPHFLGGVSADLVAGVIGFGWHAGLGVDAWLSDEWSIRARVLYTTLDYAEMNLVERSFSGIAVHLGIAHNFRGPGFILIPSTR